VLEVLGHDLGLPVERGGVIFTVSHFDARLLTIYAGAPEKLRLAAHNIYAGREVIVPEHLGWQTLLDADAKELKDVYDDILDGPTCDKLVERGFDLRRVLGHYAGTGAVDQPGFAGRCRCRSESSATR